MSNIKIGITERGDAGLDFAWYDKIKNGQVRGAILITKQISDTFIQKVLDLHQNHHAKLIVHCGCTGLGGTILEPNVPKYTHQLSQLKKLIDAGFPIEQCVLRIDPIIPTDDCIACAVKVLREAFTLGLLPTIRVRISVLDEYKHVKERLRAAGYRPYYGTQFHASYNDMDKVIHALTQYNLAYETCAEPFLRHPNFKQTGCVSETDLQILQLPVDTNLINMQNRHGCKCLACKTELLTIKHRCPHQCLYCYWKD